MGLTTNQPQGPQDEDIGASEEVIAILRKEGEEMKPADTRCHAKVGSGRCKNEITFDTDGDHWSVWCSDHLKEETTAREEGGPRVERADK